MNFSESVNNNSKTKRHVNIPVFIPHLGCPNDCVFCNQRSISGKSSFDAENVVNEIEEALSTLTDVSCENIEIAYFGGSFTGIERPLMVRLLDIAESFIKAGRVTSIRMSTRPDYISCEIIDILKNYHVKTIELGIQSMSEDVLRMSKRGHSKEDTIKACELVKKYGFQLIGQMMIGLPGSDMQSEIDTAEAICRMGADGARIYPTMVLHQTELCEMTKRKEYQPLQLNDAIERTSAVLHTFVKNDIPVIRIGLHADESLCDQSGIYAGAYHPAMGELCENALYFQVITEAFDGILKKGSKKLQDVEIEVPKGHISKAVGNKKLNIEKLKQKYGFRKIKIKENESLLPYHVNIKLL